MSVVEEIPTPTLDEDEDASAALSPKHKCDIFYMVRECHVIAHSHVLCNFCLMRTAEIINYSLFSRCVCGGDFVHNIARWLYGRVGSGFTH